MKKLSGIIIKLLLMLLIVTVTLESCSRRSFGCYHGPNRMLSKPPKRWKKPKTKYREPGTSRKKHTALLFPSVPNHLSYIPAPLNAEPLNALHAEPSSAERCTLNASQSLPAEPSTLPALKL